MIKGITSNTQYIVVQGGSPMTPYFSPGAQGAGQMRYNTNTSSMEVWDGMSWKEISMAHTSIGLSGDAESLLDWARQERSKQWARESLAKDNPALQKALEAMKRAEANFDIISKFVEHDQNETTTTGT